MKVIVLLKMDFLAVIQTAMERIIEQERFTDLEEFMHTMVHWKKKKILANKIFDFTLEKWDEFLLFISEKLQTGQEEMVSKKIIPRMNFGLTRIKALLGIK